MALSLHPGCTGESIYMIRYISDVIIWPPIWFVYPSCQHLTSLASGHQYLGCLRRKSQIEQSPSHMRPDTWQLRTYTWQSYTVRDSVLHRSLCGVRSVRLMCPLWYDLSLGYPLQLSKVLVSYGGIWRWRVLRCLWLKLGRPRATTSIRQAFLSGAPFSLYLWYTLCSGFVLLYLWYTLYSGYLHIPTAASCAPQFWQVHCYAV